ncbi:MAG: hypothetical protein DCC56_01545 [Anaerolineae bacterium]|nr:MAG: hypothetical protein DCC56_01545 [Anaerolineae bacterium]WKZ44721.1 MAG: hypothetical protein QY302_02890 [Anaerolineales bacterium]
MPTTKRKPSQDDAEPEEQASIGKATTKRKNKQEKTTKPDDLQDLKPNNQPPALTINIQSWTTPIVAIVMLVIGALAGFYARPTVLGQLPESASDTSPVVAIPTEDRSEQQQQLMASLTPQIRHFIGDSSAPVTIIEFGDFQ